MKKRHRGKPRAGRPAVKVQDIISPSKEASQSKIRPKWRPYYKRLVELRDAMLNRQTDLARDAIQEEPVFSTHMADAGTDTYDRDFALGMLSAQQDAVYQIEQALDRIRQGTYGVCELTGKPIEKARLEAIPWTRFSFDAEHELEREGKLRRAALGPRENVALDTQPSGEGDEATAEEPE